MFWCNLRTKTSAHYTRGKIESMNQLPTLLQYPQDAVKVFDYDFFSAAPGVAPKPITPRRKVRDLPHIRRQSRKTRIFEGRTNFTAGGRPF